MPLNVSSPFYSVFQMVSVNELSHIQEPKHSSKREAIMSAKPSKSTEAAASKDSDEKEDLGALIYRESQLRKKQAAAVENSERSSTASTHRATSTRRVAVAAVCGDDSSATAYGFC